VSSVRISTRPQSLPQMRFQGSVRDGGDEKYPCCNDIGEAFQNSGCPTCTYSNADGGCSGNQITSRAVGVGVKEPEICDGPRSCYSDGCKLDLGRTCTAAADCESGHCECLNADCTSRVCAPVDCLCQVYDSDRQQCSTTISLDNYVQQPPVPFHLQLWLLTSSSACKRHEDSVRASPGITM
jgi:hypothetical protein